MAADADFKKEKLLSKSFIFDALDSNARQELADFSYVKRYAAGDTIFTMGMPGHSMMAIAEGSVRVSMFTPSDREVTLNDLTAGDVFGEIALLDGQDRSANVKALTNCTLVVLERRALLDLLQRDPGLSIKLIELLCQRVRRSDERMIEIAFLDLPARLARLVLRLSTAAPASAEKPLTKLSQSQSELASMTGNSRENVNRCLRKWQKADLIDLQGGWLIIKDRPRLEALAHGE
jgi:CRP/FNR family cyclic AMP-dependent transcriptional regulator